jgi:hypothetical protein
MVFHVEIKNRAGLTLPARIALKRKTTQAKRLVPLDISRGFAHTPTMLL